MVPTPETDFSETESVTAAGFELLGLPLELLLELPQALRPTAAPAASARAAV